MKWNIIIIHNFLIQFHLKKFECLTQRVKLYSDKGKSNPRWSNMTAFTTLQCSEIVKQNSKSQVKTKVSSSCHQETFTLQTLTWTYFTYHFITVSHNVTFNPHKQVCVTKLKDYFGRTLATIHQWCVTSLFSICFATLANKLGRFSGSLICVIMIARAQIK